MDESLLGFVEGSAEAARVSGEHDRALRMAKHEAETRIKHRALSVMKHLFKRVDKDGGGTVDLDEFKRYFKVGGSVLVPWC